MKRSFCLLLTLLLLLTMIPATVFAESILAITTQPTDVTVASGKTVKLTVAATGEGLSYQWYLKKTGAAWI